MNQLIQLLLLSAAGRTVQKKAVLDYTHAHCKKINCQSHSISPSQKKASCNSVRSNNTCIRNTEPMEQEAVQNNTLLSALNAADRATDMNPSATGPFSLPPLDYPYDALSPNINETTLRIHHSQNHQAYVDRLNEALALYPESYLFTINELLLFPDRLPGDIQRQVTQNAGGHYNHSLMWKILGPPQNSKPTGALAEAITTQFGSFENLKQAMSASANSVFGSGYSYLILNPYGRLLIVTTNNQTTPIPLRSIPLVPIDMWEHAYFLQYQNKRNDYIQNYLDLINWEQVGKRYEAALKELTSKSQ